MTREEGICIFGISKTSEEAVWSFPQSTRLQKGALAGVAEQGTNSTERVAALRKVLKAGGFAGFLLGFNPYTASDELLAEKTKELPLVRIRPCGIGSGASDPGGWLWIPLVALLVLFALK